MANPYTVTCPQCGAKSATLDTRQHAPLLALDDGFRLAAVAVDQLHVKSPVCCNRCQHQGMLEDFATRQED